MDCPPDWDLLALVRSCSSTTTTVTTNVSPPLHVGQHPPQTLTTSAVVEQVEQEPSSSPLIYGFSRAVPTTSFLNRGGLQHGLQDICTTSTTCYSSNRDSWKDFHSLSSSSSIITPPHQQQQQQQPQPQMRRVVRPSQVIFGATSQTHRPKKRKNLMKKVCNVPAEGLSSDMWAWRKYGQKPIKGSPYPRGYYRCSSSKGCLARKQVERNRSDPKMFIVTYTSEHNHPMPTHRNSLAGSTRQKAGTPPENSSPSTTTLSPLTELSESKTEGEDMIKDEDENDLGGITDMMLNDDFYVGFEQIDGGSDDSDCFSEHFSPSSEFPWLSNGSTTATAAGGG